MADRDSSPFGNSPIAFRNGPYVRKLDFTPPGEYIPEIASPFSFGMFAIVTLTPAQTKFILHWGEMGPSWGINRTVAQIHALLFITPEILDAEEISRVLDLSRSNVSSSLRELVGWGVVRKHHVIGDRRDRFEAIKDVMELFRVLLDERKRRELDPSVELLQSCIAEPSADPFTRDQFTRMLELVLLIGRWSENIGQLDNSSLELLLQRGPEIVAMFR